MVRRPREDLAVGDYIDDEDQLLATAIFALACGDTASAQTTAKKPNIVMIMADDVGIWNVSAYQRNDGKAHTKH